MAVILLVPHILVVLHFTIAIKAKTDKTVHSLWCVQDFRRILMLHLEDDLIVLVGDDLSLQSPQFTEHLWKTPPLPCDLVACVAVAPWVVVAFDSSDVGHVWMIRQGAYMDFSAYTFMSSSEQLPE